MYKFISSSSKSKLIPLLSNSILYKSAYSSNLVSNSRNEISKFFHKPKNGNGRWVLWGQSGFRSYSSESDRETMNYDVVIVGAGPAGLSAAIKLKQLCQQKEVDLSVCVVEKGAEVGAHILSGNVFEPRALDELVPHWKEEEAPIDVPVTSDNFWLLTENRAFSLPSPFDNKGNYVIRIWKKSIRSLIGFRFTGNLGMAFYEFMYQSVLCVTT
ncbi:hypothetical protein MTR67_052588 [Solanum verrucosum]|uniref:Electron transfer flavoprotein-ubiquinone oxidoreductase n=1 Tax=Solanum verrucosum TaxID=315347 RepID=A0AAF0V9F6_SOLVR|nr:hypothetical protein MTR67_052588 [Solanum verrucosum]